MARRRKSDGPTPVEAITHDRETRANLPTADAHEFVTPEIEAPRKVRYARDPSLDPQLVWRGKDEQDSEDLEVDAPPIYIQEKIDPRVLIENLRKTAKEGQEEPELTLFEDFDGLTGLDDIEYYQHAANWSNRLILGDSLQVMTSLAEREALRGHVQMIYVDPPYGIEFKSNWQTTVSSRSVTDGKYSHISREVEQIRAFRDTWEDGIHSYLSYLRDRLTAARELLTESGSLFFQIGDNHAHLVRAVLDEVFGADNFCVEIGYQKTTGTGSPNEVPTMLPAVFDWILWYAKDRSQVKYRQLFKEKILGGEGGSLYTRVRLADGTQTTLNAVLKEHGELPPGARAWGAGDMTSSTGVDKTRFPVTIDGRTFRPNPGVWKTDQTGMQRLIDAGRVHVGTGRNLGYVRYFDDFPVTPLTNIWTDTVGQNQYGGTKIYVVQTALKAVQRCMLAATDPGDLVLDPTSGSGTIAVVAEHWGRRWIAIDTSRVAVALTRQRLMGYRYPYYLLADSEAGRLRESEVGGAPPPGGATTGDLRHGFVYERAKHVTLKSIANNPDIGPGLSEDEINEAIDRHADHELLLDRPAENRSIVRVTGPFTVEGLSPQRSLTFSLEPPLATGDSERDPQDFARIVLENLSEAGVQNGRRNERLEFTTVEAYPGRFVHAVADQADQPDGHAMKVAVSIGPQYGTVGPRAIKDAAREALKMPQVDMLCVMGFAFDPAAIGTQSDELITSDEGFDVAAVRRLGHLPVLVVRMNPDLVMGDSLKKTNVGNLFTVFGEPDLKVEVEDGQARVSVAGVDVYDPSTGELRSDGVDKIALWMIDTDYDEESFFVRHCYFTGGQDPYSKLKKSLNADIDQEAWATLYRTESRPFPRPESGKIAVKVINDYGDEVMKILDV